MNLITRRRFNASLLLSATAVAAPRIGVPEGGAQQATFTPTVPLGGSDLSQWPKGYDPRELGTSVAEQPRFRPTTDTAGRQG